MANTLAFPSGMSDTDIMSAAEQEWGSLEGVQMSKVGDKVYLFPKGTTQAQIVNVTGGIKTPTVTPTDTEDVPVAPTIDSDATPVEGDGLTWGETLASAAKRFVPSVGEFAKGVAKGAGFIASDIWKTLESPLDVEIKNKAYEGVEGFTPKTPGSYQSAIGQSMLHIASDLNKRILRTAMGDTLHTQRMTDEELANLKVMTDDLDAQLAGGPTEMIGEYLAENYGSIEGFKKHLAGDPAVVMSDIAGVLMLAGNVSRTEKLAKLAGYADPISLAASTVKAPLKAIQVSSVPSKIYNSAVKFSKKLAIDDPKGISIPELRRVEQLGLEDWITPNVKGLRKVNDKINLINQEIGSLIDRATATGEKMKVEALFEDFDDLKRLHYANNPQGVTAAKQIDAIKKEVIESNKRIDREALTAREAQEFKTSVYKKFRQYYEGEGATPASKEAVQQMASKTKAFIEGLVPEISETNALHSDWKKLRESIEDAAKNTDQSALLPFSSAIKTTAGATTGAMIGGEAGATIGGGIGFTLGFIDSNPTIKANLAIALDKATKLGIDIPTPPILANLASFRMGEYVGQQTQED